MIIEILLTISFTTGIFLFKLLNNSYKTEEEEEINLWASDDD